MEPAHDHTPDTHAAMRHAVAEAVAEGIKAAASDPELWAAALVAMKRRAAGATGNFIIDALVSLAKRMAWVVVIGLGIYSLGGWSALAAVLKIGVAK